MRKTILIIDDEKDMGRMLREYFELMGYGVTLAENGLAGMEKAGRQPDLILLDINMPDIDGLEVCRRIREHVTCPILFLTSRVENQDKLEGFAVGGDDYIVKPFDIDELGARVEAHLRREDRSAQTPHRLFFDDSFMIDYTAKQVSCAGTVISLTPKEYEIVELLSTHPGQVLGWSRIIEQIWDIASDAEQTALREQVSRLRAKLSAAGCKPYIETVWGVGYKWVK